MTTVELAILFRGVILIIVTLAASGSIFLGWKLYSDGVLTPANAEGRYEKLHIKFVKVAPGFFFAIFGTSVLVYLVAHPMEVSEPCSTAADSAKNSHTAGNSAEIRRNAITSAYSKLTQTNFQQIAFLEENKKAVDNKPQNVCPKVTTIKFSDESNPSSINSEELATALDVIIERENVINATLPTLDRMAVANALGVVRLFRSELKPKVK